MVGEVRIFESENIKIVAAPAIANVGSCFFMISGRCFDTWDQMPHTFGTSSSNTKVTSQLTQISPPINTRNVLLRKPL